MRVRVRERARCRKQETFMGSQSGLRRSNNGMIAGVCGGIAESLNVDPTIVRLVYVLVSFFSAAFPGIIVYIVLWLVMPPPEGR